LFIFVRLTHGYDVNLIFTFGMHNDQHFAPQYTKCYPTLLTVVHTIILEGESGACEDQFGIGEIQAAPVAGSLSLVTCCGDAMLCKSRHCDRAFLRPRAPVQLDAFDLLQRFGGQVAFTAIGATNNRDILDDQ
jgi:hypothetical protein